MLVIGKLFMQNCNCFPAALSNQVAAREIVQNLFNSFLHHIHSLLQVSVKLHKIMVWKPLFRYSCKEIPKVQRHERIIPLQCLTTLSSPDLSHNTYHSLLDEAVYIRDKTSSKLLAERLLPKLLDKRFCII